MRDLDELAAVLRSLQAPIDRHITRERVRRYLAALVDTPAPSTMAGPSRVPVLRRLLADDNALSERLTLDPDFGRTGSPVLLTGARESEKPLWYFAHLDTISYLIQSADGRGDYPLVPFCVHLMEDGERPAMALRYDLWANRLAPVAEGWLLSREGQAWFRSTSASPQLQPGDRVVFRSVYREEGASGLFTGSMDNAGGVAALALAAPVLAEAGLEALLAFPDEEEGPVGPGNHMIGRGTSRLMALLPTPDLTIVTDVQQGGGDPDADARGGIVNSTRLGGGAVLAEFSSFARGAVTPPDLYVLARHVAGLLAEFGVAIQESNNAYSSRSDDASLLLKTPNILLLGFPGFNRHFDRGEPRAHLDDVVHLAKALVYLSVVGPWFRDRRRQILGAVG